MTEKEIRTLKEDIVFQTELSGFPLVFHTTYGLFSPKEIDEGTLLLLKHLEIKPDDKTLDVGCGYGPIGLTMAKLAPKARTYMVDNNFVAVNFAKKNTSINNILNTRIYLSNGFSTMQERDFDVIASNLPAKIGKELFWILLHDAKQYLKPGGKFYVVTISGLREFIKRNLMETFG